MPVSSITANRRKRTIQANAYNAEYGDAPSAGSRFNSMDLERKTDLSENLRRSRLEIAKTNFAQRKADYKERK